MSKPAKPAPGNVTADKIGEATAGGSKGRVSRPGADGWHGVDDSMPAADTWVIVVLDNGEEMKGMFELTYEYNEGVACAFHYEWRLEDGTTTTRVIRWRHL